MARSLPLSMFPVMLSLVMASGQNTSPAPTVQPGAGEPVKAASSPAPEPQVTLEVRVTDKSGSPIRGLQQQDFTVLDNQQAQEIKLFHPVDRAAPSPGDPPVDLILVVDAINAPVEVVTDERRYLKKYLLQDDGKLALPVSIIFFSGAGKTQLTPPSRNGKALAELCEHVELGPPTSNLLGSVGGFERFDVSVKALTSIAAYLEKLPGRKLMIWISPGWPLFSEPNIQMSVKDYQSIFDSIVGISAALRRAHITLYEVDPLGVANTGTTRIQFYQTFLKGVVSASHALFGNLGLQVIATQSGGRILASSNDLAAEIAACAADADVFYILAFKAPLATHAIEYHPIEVTIAKPSATARTRTGYYAQP